VERVGEPHRRACAGFSVVVAAAAGQWEAPSPCEGWSARDLVEHVIGFHEVLVLRPLEIKAHRPREGTAARWTATETAINASLGLLNDDMARLLPALTTDVLVHTWDLARAVGADETLDSELVALALAAAERSADTLAASGMYAPPVAVSADATPQQRMLARYGRSPVPPA
jgi:uncharacterized protein (TIGR03086 family)